MKKYYLTDGTSLRQGKLLNKLHNNEIKIEDIANPDQDFFNYVFRETKKINLIPSKYIQQHMVKAIIKYHKKQFKKERLDSKQIVLDIQVIPGQILTCENLEELDDMKNVGVITKFQFCAMSHNELLNFLTERPNLFFVVPVELFSEKEQFYFISKGCKIIEKSNLMKLCEKARIEYVGQNPMAVEWLSNDICASNEKIKPYVGAIVKYVNKNCVYDNIKTIEQSEKIIEKLNQAQNIINRKRTEAISSLNKNAQKDVYDGAVKINSKVDKFLKIYPENTKN